MEIKVLNLLVVSKNIHIIENISEVIEHIDFNCKIATHLYKNILEVSNILPQLIILDYNKSEELIAGIKYIKNSYEFKEIPILVAIKEEMVDLLNELMNLGIKDYIIKPWDKLEVKFRLRNMLEYVYMLKNYKNKEVKFDSLLNNIPLMARIKDNNSNYVSVNEEFISYYNENKLNMIIESIPFGVWFSDINGTISNVNDIFLEYVGYSREEVIGKCIYKLKYSIYSEKNIYQDNIVISSKKSHVFKENIIDNGEEISIEIYRSPVLDTSNKVIGVVGLIRDVTEIRKAHDEIRRLAYTDFLTDLPNRQGLYNYINSNLKDKDRHISMLFIDLDNFKKLNDKYGSYYGDRVLLAIAEALKAKCNKHFLARTGGDEFVVVLENITDINILKDKVNEVFSVIKVEIKDSLNAIKISPSIGVVSGLVKENSLEKLLIKGDLALLKAKEQGKNQCVFYTDKIESENIFNLQIEEDLKNAINNKEIVLFYQPQFTSNKELKGFEALFRWKNNKYKRVPVIEVIKIIESKGLIDSIGAYIIEQAAIFAKKINAFSNKKLIVSVNISAIQLMDDNFLYKFMNIIEEVGVDPEFIGIELTETVLLEEMEKNIKKLKYIKKLGVTISLDDFGTGYSSLNYLIKLPISELKIDKSFVQSIESRDEYVKLIKLMSDIGHLLNLKVVAEGVEEDSQLKMLEKINVDYIQGYLFSKPVPEEIAVSYID